MAEAREGQIRLENVRLSFEHLFEAHAVNDGDEPAFGATLLLDPSTESGAKNRQKIRAAIKTAAAAKWGNDIPKIKAEKFCFRDGDLEDYDGYAGMWYLAARNKKRPVVVDRDRSPLAQSDGRPYSGCYVMAIVRIWAMDNKHGKRICASLEAVQFMRDGEGFGAAQVNADDVFDVLDGDGNDAGFEVEGDDGDDASGLL